MIQYATFIQAAGAQAGVADTEEAVGGEPIAAGRASGGSSSMGG